MIEKWTPDLLRLPTTFYDVSVSCNRFSRTEMRLFGASGTDGLNYISNPQLKFQYSIRRRRIWGTLARFRWRPALRISRFRSPNHRQSHDICMPRICPKNTIFNYMVLSTILCVVSLCVVTILCVVGFSAEQKTTQRREFPKISQGKMHFFYFVSLELTFLLFCKNVFNQIWHFF